MILEPLNGYFVGLDKYESIYLSRSSTEYPLRGFVILTFLFASVLRTILRTHIRGCAEVKRSIQTPQGGQMRPRLPSRGGNRLSNIDDDLEQGTLEPYLINKALAPVVNWGSLNRLKRKTDVLVIKLIIIFAVSLVLSF